MELSDVSEWTRCLQTLKNYDLITSAHTEEPKYVSGPILGLYLVYQLENIPQTYLTEVTFHSTMNEDGCVLQLP